MTSILTLMAENIRRVPITMRFPERAAVAKRYRGLVRMSPSDCLACGICDYVCVSAAITVTNYEDRCDWQYEPGRCTFCSKCVRYCPGNALSQEEERPPAYEEAGQLAQHYTIEFAACTTCGAPTMPYNEAMLSRAFDAVTDQLRGTVRLCDTCRMKAAQTAAAETFVCLDPARRSTDER